MPLYEYECEECGEIREVIQKFSDTPLTVCSCCSGKLQKLISNNSFHLKGGGWYVTDYGSSPTKKGNTTAPGSCDSEVNKTQGGKNKVTPQPNSGSD